LVAFRLERVQVAGDRLDALPHLTHPRLHVFARLTATARLVALGVQLFQLASQIARFSIELEDPVQWRLEAARGQHLPHFVGILTNTLKGRHGMRAIIRARPCTTSCSSRSRDPTATRSSVASPRG